MSNTSAQVILDSRAPCGKRLVTVQATCWRAILAEVNTHRDKSRNSASSRAMPILANLSRCETNPFIPDAFTSNKKGMQGGATIEENDRAREIWLSARDAAVAHAKQLEALNVHKQYANRLVEPFQYHTIILSGTNWANMFAQRCHPDAQPEFQELAWAIYDAIMESTPRHLNAGEWHMPYIRDEDINEAMKMTFMNDVNDRHAEALEILKRVSVARCARVSYLTHDGVRSLEADLKMCDRLLTGGYNGHVSPFEHVARALAAPVHSGNFVGFEQLRKIALPQECVTTWGGWKD